LDLFKSKHFYFTFVIEENKITKSLNLKPWIKYIYHWKKQLIVSLCQIKLRAEAAEKPEINNVYATKKAQEIFKITNEAKTQYKKKSESES